MICRHEAISFGLVYDYCERCGAVRRGDRPERNQRADAWHSCERCRLVNTQEVQR